MTPRDVYARSLAAALLDGTWEPTAMEARLADALGLARPWMHTLVRATRSRYAHPPSPDTLAAWLDQHEAFGDGFDEGHPIVRFATPSPEMAESPWHVPPLATTRELATWIGFDIDTLAILADRRGISRSSDQAARHYRYAWIPKPSGGHRLVEAPKLRLRTVQRRLLDGIISAIPPHDAAHGFRAGRSVRTFAEPHVGRAVVLRIDLQAFFTSVFRARVIGILRTAGYPAEVSRVIAALCTHRTPADVLVAAPMIDLARLRAPHLPQGAPTSGALANLAAFGLDVRVAGLARKLDAAYTRYADDLVLSGGPHLARAAPTIVARLGAIAIEEGFTVNFRKTRVMTAGDRQRIAGVVVNEKLSATRADVEQLRAILHNCRRFGPASQNRDAHADFRAHLRGRIAWVRSLDAVKGERLMSMFELIDWT